MVTGKIQGERVKTFLDSQDLSVQELLYLYRYITNADAMHPRGNLQVTI